MIFRRLLAAALLVLAFGALPELLWLGAHALGDHEHAAVWPDLARALVHGHAHAETDPDHEHPLVPSPQVRQHPPQDLEMPGMVALADFLPERLPLYNAPAWQEAIWSSGSSPPRLLLLCTLLI